MAMKARMKGGPRHKPTSLNVMVKGVERGMWPTPKGSPSGPDYARAGRDGSGGDDLATAVARETFPTPKAQDAKHGAATEWELRQNGKPQQLHVEIAKRETFPTPRVEDGECAGAHRGKPDSLHSYTRLFPTPCVADAEGGRTSKGSGRPDEAGLAVTVKRLPTPTAQDAKINGAASQHERNTKPLNAEVGGALNPDWVCWLMGWPQGWDSTEPMTADPATWTGSSEQWAEEPADVPRVATGIPDRVARLRMLGNGWVPQVALWVASRLTSGARV